MPALSAHRPPAPRRRLALTPLALAAALAGAAFHGPGAAQTAPLPTGAAIAAGQARIDQQGTVLTVQQASTRLVADWRSFDIAAGHTVRFEQPSAAAVALNRVSSGSASVIQGALQANGQVFLVNPAGVLFSAAAQVDVGGLVASTLAIGHDDFLAGRLQFNGQSSAAVVNQGRLSAAPGGTVALVGARIVNDGSIHAPGGSVLLGAGSRVTLDLGGPVQLRVDNDQLETLIRNGGAIRAEGGRVALVSQAARSLSASVINHSGVIEADALDASRPGQVMLFAHGGHTQVEGTLSARGGEVETSGRTLTVADSAVVRAAHWLVDPVDITIEATGGSNLAGASIAASRIQDVLEGRNGETAGAVTLVADNDILVNEALTWSSNRLTLSAGRDLRINAPLTATGSGSLAFRVGQASADGANGTWTVGSAGRLVVPTPEAFTWQKGSAGAAKNLVLDNGLLRFGNGTEAGFTAEGLLKQPFTFDNTTPGRNGWFRLTFSSRPLEFAIGAGGDGSNPWNYNGQVLMSGSSYGAALTERSIDLSGYREGMGTVVTRGTVTFGSGQRAEVSQRYTLDTGARFVNMATEVTNRDSATLGNLRIWVGTGDDFVGQSDVNTKTKGNLVNGQFEALTEASAAATAIRITESDGSQGAGVLFYSTTTGADSVHARCCSFSNVTNLNPRSGQISAMNDGSYAMFMRVADLAPGASGGMSVYYAAAPVAELAAAVTSVGQAANNTPAAPTPVYLRLEPGSSVYGDTPLLGWSLYDALSGGSLVTNAAPTGSVSWLGAPTSGSPVGQYDITYGGGISLGNSGYALNAGASVRWSVTPRPITVTADALTKVYGQADPALVYRITTGSLVDGDSLAGAPSRAAGENVGRYAVSLTSLANDNYAITRVDGSLAITPRPITVAADNATKVYGQPDPVLTWRLTTGSLVAGDSLAGILSRGAGEGTGRYTVSAAGLGHPNYQVQAVDGQLLILPAVHVNLMGGRTPVLTAPASGLAPTTVSAAAEPAGPAAADGAVLAVFDQNYAAGTGVLLMGVKLEDLNAANLVFV